MDQWLQPLLRFVHYAVLLGMFGLTVFRAAGLKRVDLRPGADRNPAILVSGAVLAPVLSTALMLVSIAAMMGQSVWMLDWATIEAMLITTDIGWAFIVRLVVLSLALGVSLFRPRLQHGWLIAAMLYGLALLTLAWSGHAAATEGAWGLLHRLNDGLHLLAAGCWMGAIGWFLQLTIRAHRYPDSFAPEPLLNVMHLFAPLGVTLVAIVAITGAINAELVFGLANSGNVMSTDYGWLLAAKIVLVVGMFACGASNAAISRRRVKSARQSFESSLMALTALRTFLAVELTLAIVILGLVAMLGMVSPMG